MMTLYNKRYCDAIIYILPEIKKASNFAQCNVLKAMQFKKIVS